jgi:hypothetical protein
MLGLGLQCIPLLVLIIKQKLWRSGSLQQMNPKSLERWQFLFASTWLLWMVIFNHMAESATYVIAVGGALLMYAHVGFSENLDSQETEELSQTDKVNLLRVIGSYFRSLFLKCSWPLLLAFTMMVLFTILGPTDIYPKEIRFWIVETAQLKAFPCIMIWGISLIKMLNLLRD